MMCQWTSQRPGAYSGYQVSGFSNSRLQSSFALKFSDTTWTTFDFFCNTRTVIIP